MSAGEYEFQMEVTAKDLTGYYYVRWDRATRLTVLAESRAAAFARAWVVMGECPRGHGWAWTARITHIEAVVAAPSGVSG